MKDSLLKRKVWKYRILGMLYIPVHILWHFFFIQFPQITDPLDTRVLFSGVVLLIVLLSFKSRSIALRLEWFALLVSILTNGLAFYLVHVHSFPVPLIVYYLFSVFIYSLIFDSFLFLLAYHAANLTIILFGNWTIHPAEIFEIASWLVVNGFISGINFFEKNFLNQKLKNKAKMLHRKAIGLMESEKKYKTIAENIPGIVFYIEKVQMEVGKEMVSIFTADRKVNEFFHSPSTSVVHDKEELLSDCMNLLDYVHPDERTSLFHSLGEALEKREAWKWEGRTMYGNVQKYIQIIAKPHERMDGKIVWDGIILDQTEFKKALDDLEIQRMKNIYHEKMSALGQMSSGIAHEINNPLFIIDGKAHHILKLLRDEVELPRETLRDMVLVISRTTKRIAKIIKGLKTFSRDGGKDPFLTTSIKRILDETLEISRTRVEKKGIELKININPEMNVQKIECRATQIMQVLISLLNNAIDALENAPEKWIEISVEREGLELLFMVSDSGPGVASDIQSKIMNPFYTTKAVGQGTGLGLSISLGIAKSHNGSLYLDKKYPPNRFILRIPIIQNLKNKEPQSA